MQLSSEQLSFVDSRVSFDLGSQNGYYSVGSDLYLWKPMALSAASQSKKPIQWHFHDELWEKLNWRQSSGVSLSTLYRTRAHQLRNKYDYLILAWSGGGDSTAILDTFIDNGIHLDEVVIAWALKGSSGRYTPTASDTSPENFLSEWDYAIEPRIQWLLKNRPRIRVTVCDWSDNLMCKPDDNVLKITNSQAFTGMLRSREIDNVVRERSEKSPNVGVILGVNPAYITILNNEYVATFFNDFFGEGRSDIMYDSVPRKIEYFYWSPDLPEIVLEQCHEVLQFLNCYPSMKCYFTHTTINKAGKWTAETNDHQKEAERLIKKILFYPSFDPRVLQVKKHPNRVKPEHYSWLYTNSHSKQFTDPFDHLSQSYYRMIGPEYFFNRGGSDINYRPLFSKYHVIGKIVEPFTQDPRYRQALHTFNQIMPWYM